MRWLPVLLLSLLTARAQFGIGNPFYVSAFHKPAAVGGGSETFTNVNEIAGLWDWFHATNLPTSTETTYTFATWTNQGISKNLLIFDGTRSNNVQNSKPAIFFDGAGSGAITEDSHNETYSNMAAFAVFKLTSGDANDAIFAANPTYWYVGAKSSDGTDISAQNSSTDYGSIDNPGRFIVYGVRREGVDFMTFLDGVPLATNTISAAEFTTIISVNVGANSALGANMVGWVCEVGLYTNTVAYADFVSMMRGLTNIYSIHP